MNTVLEDKDGLLMQPCAECSFCGVTYETSEYKCAKDICAHLAEYQAAERRLINEDIEGESV